MKPTIMTAALAIATVTMMPHAADAAPYWPWCSQSFGLHGGGLTVCAYATREQCIATQFGVGGICRANPFPPPPPHDATRVRSAKPHRHAGLL